MLEPLFPRYLFIELGRSLESMSWSPIRSTTGVSRLVTFGQSPARVSEAIVDELRAHEQFAQTRQAFTPGDTLLIERGPFKGLEAVFQMLDGEQRVMVLLDLMGKPVRVKLGVNEVSLGS